MMQHRRHSKKRKGAVLLISLVMIIMLCMLAACMVDVGYLQSCRSRIQSGADAAAIAAAMRLGNENTETTQEEAKLWAIEFANQNLEGHGQVLKPNDVVFGNWDPFSKSFTPGSNEPNAVQVLVRREAGNGNAVTTFFSKIFAVENVDVAASAVAMLSSSSSAEGLPLGLRGPGFGAIDTKLSSKNPFKDGPSEPNNSNSFSPGEKVIVFIFAAGGQAPVHLALNIDADGVGASAGNVAKILNGESAPVEMQVGDTALVLGEGTGINSIGNALDDRLDLPADDPGRTVVMPVLETLPDSRNDSGRLTREVRISDFVSVHLDGIVEEDFVDPNNANKTIKLKYIEGTITTRRAETSFGGGTPSGAGGGNVSTVELVN